MKFLQYIGLLGFTLSTVGCALAPGLQTYDLPEQGIYQTELGSSVNVIQLNQNTLRHLQQNQNTDIQDISRLFRHSQLNYKLSPGDILSIYLWAYPEITPPVSNANNDQSIQANGFQIDQTGYIQFPIIGRYKAAGKSLAQVNQELRSQLSRYLKTPDVIARVLSYQGQRYSVQGNVMKGGQFFLSDQPVSVYTALGLAGGVNTQFGDNTSITLVRQGRTFQLNSIDLEKAGYSLHNLLIQPNDTLYVNSKENQKVYVMGESGKNQSLLMRDQGMTLSDVLGESLGLNPNTASASRIYVLRSDAQTQQTELYHMNLLSLGDFGLANQFKMRSNDIVYVDSTGLARWQRVVTQILPFSNALYNIDRLGQ
ncbi:polysaccharide biosynthesis/export family protein [Acinetobacter tibetensis]|uniref:Polysaccharide biosynthesis/export family protein n=1 Tax=Acinetobacter tibetensis TaxID=2943497 RepID=A0AAE9LRA3_9GAMM|nr:polysaccharide biosynthesis/export family protein [Acinetobacter tibetensis]USE83218.1 polysaccharide biosynthesis/export family protein [Acinetobacter tibetensis]